jgi:hypothetical protein
MVGYCFGYSRHPSPRCSVGVDLSGSRQVTRVFTTLRTATLTDALLTAGLGVAFVSAMILWSVL